MSFIRRHARISETISDGNVSILFFDSLNCFAEISPSIGCAIFAVVPEILSSEFGHIPECGARVLALGEEPPRMVRGVQGDTKSTVIQHELSVALTRGEIRTYLYIDNNPAAETLQNKD